MYVIYGALIFLVIPYGPKVVLASVSPTLPTPPAQDAPLVEFFYWNVDPFFHIPNRNPENIHGNYDFIHLCNL